jgi:Leucine-rich repeat (LRR) protein
MNVQSKSHVSFKEKEVTLSSIEKSIHSLQRNSSEKVKLDKKIHELTSNLNYSLEIRNQLESFWKVYGSEIDKDLSKLKKVSDGTITSMVLDVRQLKFRRDIVAFQKGVRFINLFVHSKKPYGEKIQAINKLEKLIVKISKDVRYPKLVRVAFEDMWGDFAGDLEHCLIFDKPTSKLFKTVNRQIEVIRKNTWKNFSWELPFIDLISHHTLKPNDAQKIILKIESFLRFSKDSFHFSITCKRVYAVTKDLLGPIKTLSSEYAFLDAVLAQTKLRQLKKFEDLIGEKYNASKFIYSAMTIPPSGRFIEDSASFESKFQKIYLEWQRTQTTGHDAVQMMEKFLQENQKILSESETLILSSNPIWTLSARIGTWISTWHSSITKLVLTGNDPKDDRLSWLSKLPKLKHLKLDGYKFFKIPEGILTLRQLTQLTITNAKLSSLPDAMMWMDNVRVLCFDHNEFTNIPRAVIHLKQIAGLSFSHNRVSAVLPEISKLPHLEVLRVDHNLLTALPIELTSMKLKELVADSNPLDLSTQEWMQKFSKSCPKVKFDGKKAPKKSEKPQRQLLLRQGDKKIYVPLTSA